MPSKKQADGQETAAVRSVLRSIFTLIFPGSKSPRSSSSSKAEPPATHVAVATDHVIESFRNELFEGYKTGSGIPENLYSQFGLLEKTLELAGFKVWAMTDFEADDALATAAHKFAKNPKVRRILICTPDKDLAQCLTPDNTILQVDRRQEKTYRYKDTLDRFGVLPESIPDWLGLVGDRADGIPGIPGFGAKTAAALLRKYKTIENIPKKPEQWKVEVRGAARLSETLNQNFKDALLYKKLATLKKNVPNIGSLSDLKWRGPKPGQESKFKEMCEYLGAGEIPEKILKL